MIAQFRPYDKFLRSTLPRARERFLKEYGYAHDDKEKVGGEIQRRLEEVLNSPSRWSKKEIALPIELVVALTLWKGFGRRVGKHNRRSGEERHLAAAIADANKLILQIRESGEPKGLSERDQEAFSRPLESSTWSRKSKSSPIRKKAIAWAAKSNGVDPSVLEDELNHPERRARRKAKISSS